MSDIPEEIRKMFPDQPIHKMGIDDNGELHILASSEPLERRSEMSEIRLCPRCDKSLSTFEMHNEYHCIEYLKAKYLAAARELAEASGMLDHAAGEVNDLLSQLAALREQMRWIPIKDYLCPSYNEKIELVVRNKFDPTIIEVIHGWWIYEDGDYGVASFFDDHKNEVDPLFYRPLPEPPEEKL